MLEYVNLNLLNEELNKLYMLIKVASISSLPSSLRQAVGISLRLKAYLHNTKGNY